MRDVLLSNLVVRRGVLPIVVALLFVTAGCAGRKMVSIPGESKNTVAGKIAADAYLFDALLKRDGKITSFRLEMYATDSLVALAGRGYLGKGALRGVMSSKSLLVYFPTTNEFVDDDYQTLLSDTLCNLNLGSFDPVRFMYTLPDSAGIDSQFTVATGKHSASRIEYRVTSACQWTLSLVYDRRESGWRPAELLFADGKGTSLSATRREFRPAAGVPVAKFSCPIPATATRLVR